jgi:hypothetical protein
MQTKRFQILNLNPRTYSQHSHPICVSVEQKPRLVMLRRSSLLRSFRKGMIAKPEQTLKLGQRVA